MLVDATQDSLGGLPTLHKTLCLRTLLFADALHGACRHYTRLSGWFPNTTHDSLANAPHALPTPHKTFCAVLPMLHNTPHGVCWRYRRPSVSTKLPCVAKECCVFVQRRLAGHACPHYTRISAQTQVLHTTTMSCSCTNQAATSAAVRRHATLQKSEKTLRFALQSGIW